MEGKEEVGVREILKEWIKERVDECDDTVLLDLVYKLLLQK